MFRVSDPHAVSDYEREFWDIWQRAKEPLDITDRLRECGD
jgi:hypothetical protein